MIKRQIQNSETINASSTIQSSLKANRGTTFYSLRGVAPWQPGAGALFREVGVPTTSSSEFPGQAGEAVCLTCGRRSIARTVSAAEPQT